MNVRLSSIIIGLLIPLVGFAQAEVSDTIAIGNGLASDSLVFNTDNLMRPHFTVTQPRPISEYITGKPVELDMPDFSFTPGYASLYSWRGGSVGAAGATTTYPGLMKIDSGSFAVSHQSGRFLFNLGATATKYGYFMGVNTQYGVSGSISYLIAPRLSFTTFGSYYFGRPPVMRGGLPLPPSMMGYYNASTFGGYFDYEINDSFGVKVGGQAVQQIGTNRYRVEPIVTPYVKIGNVDIGLPVGEIVNGIVRSYIDHKEMQRQPAAPPQMRGPQVPQPRLQRPGR